MRQTSTKVHLSARIPRTEQERVVARKPRPVCPVKARSRHRVINGFKLSRLSHHVLGTPTGNCESETVT